MKVNYRSLNFLSAIRAHGAPRSVLATSRDEYVETLRGLAIILVVFGHVIGSNSSGGMRVADDSIFRYLYQTLEYIRMPLFTVISGWVYANKPVVVGSTNTFIRGKLRRLLIPMFFISTALFLFRMIIPGTNTKPLLSNLPFIYVFPYDLYWFLYSLLLIFIFISLLDQTTFFRTRIGWMLVSLISFALFFGSKFWFNSWPNVFSFKGAIYLLPFFLLGIGFNRYREIFFNQRMITVMSILFFVGMSMQQLSLMKVFPYQPKQSVLGVLVGVSAVLLLFNAKLKNQTLAWIGSYAYAIFLFHVFFTGGTRIMLLQMGLDNKWVILFSALVISLIIPIIIEALIKRSSLLSLVLLGLKKERKDRGAHGEKTTG